MKPKLMLDLDWLHDLLLQYENLNENSKEKINIRNSIMELLIPGAKAILLTYVVPLDFDMFQDLMLNLITQIEKWDSTKTKRSKSGEPGDWAFFTICIHNFCRNYLKKQNKQKYREVSVDPLKQPCWETVHRWELPAKIDIPITQQFKDKNLQKAYKHCIDILVGNKESTLEEKGSSQKVIKLKHEIRDKFGLTFAETKTILQYAEDTILVYIENQVGNE